MSHGSPRWFRLLLSIVVSLAVWLSTSSALENGQDPGDRSTGRPSTAAVPAPSSPAAQTESSPAPPAPSGPPRTAAPAPSTPAESTPEGWELILSEDFSRPAALGQFADVYRGWASYDGGIDTSRNLGRPEATRGVYDSSRTTSVADGVLSMYVHTDNGRPIVAAITPTPDGRYWSGQMYGRYEVRFRTDFVPGYKIAWLLWPSSDDWNEGEIDFPEGYLGRTITGSAHNVQGSPHLNAWHVDTGVSMLDWHTAVIEWTPSEITFRLDDQSWSTSEPAAMPQHPMRWALQAETHLSATPPDPGAAGHIYIDYVRAYRLA